MHKRRKLSMNENVLVAAHRLIESKVAKTASVFMRGLPDEKQKREDVRTFRCGVSARLWRTA